MSPPAPSTSTVDICDQQQSSRRRISQKWCVLGTKLLKTLIGNHIHDLPNGTPFNDLVTSDTDFKVTTFFDIEYQKRHEIEHIVTIERQ